MRMLNIYCDMDGVIADFNAQPNAVERFRKEKGFFRNLEPIKDNLKAIEILTTKENVNVFILSASPNIRCDRDKRMWLKQYAPFIKRENIIIMRNGQNKADFMKTEKGILFDDYNKNCLQWRENGNPSVQVISNTTIMEYVKSRYS